ncbi:FMN-binding negative transcriptional regulator [Amycolatopsis acidicola]|uniref:FMN-binding negative transcriptional regulator n=1 Tax=Amycolatopsis acidicola TaxID=2596893 RepID=A0A5N0V294_9PSEU|nr:FMN-binding negative transcriptional regulator [Amycolatopsis acidicola]KAA9159065.1 FMN-binding negative transcriptional regulator [Amycolatopsis acidicola]
MWVNPLYLRDRPAALGFVSRNPLATVVGTAPVEAAHLPLLLDDPEDPRYLIGHIPLADPLSAQLRRKSTVLAVFGGAGSYISPAVHAETVLPTYNFVAVHVTGGAEVVDDEDFLRAHLRALTHAGETAKSYAPYREWSIQGAAAERAESLLPRITAYRIEIERLEAKFKLGQNRTAADRRRIHDALATSADPNDREIAALMAEEAQPVSP